MAHRGRLSTLALLALLAAGASAADPAPAGEAAKDAGDSTPSQESRDCVSLHAIRSTRVLDGQTILFEMSGRQTLVNRLPRKCPGLGFEKRFAYKTSLSQLCSTDMITVITMSGRGATCGLGRFEPWVPPEQVGAKPGDGKLEAVPEADAPR